LYISGEEIVVAAMEPASLACQTCRSGQEAHNEMASNVAAMRRPRRATQAELQDQDFILTCAQRNQRRVRRQQNKRQRRK